MEVLNKLLLVVIIGCLNIDTVRCQREQWCYDKCLANSVYRDTGLNNNNNIEIYLEYKKAIITLPDPKKIKTGTITLASGETIPDVSMRNFEVDPVEGNHEKCNNKKLKETRKKINCRSRPFIVDIVSNGGKVIPDKILTKHCSGYCTINKKCTAVKSQNVSVSVQVIKDNGAVHCSTILVPEDTKCKCQCAVTHKDCNLNQKYDKKLCSCECTNHKERTHCQQKIERFHKKHYWDPKTCSCLCRKDEQCTTGTFWDKTSCRCSKKTDDG